LPRRPRARCAPVYLGRRADIRKETIYASTGAHGEKRRYSLIFGGRKRFSGPSAHRLICGDEASAIRYSPMILATPTFDDIAQNNDIIYNIRAASLFSGKRNFLRARTRRRAYLPCHSPGSRRRMRLIITGNASYQCRRFV